MNKLHALLLGVGILLTAGCDKKGPAGPAGPAAGLGNPLMSLKLLDGVPAMPIRIRVGGTEIDAKITPKDLGDAALFLCTYTLPSPAADKKAAEAAAQAETDRCVQTALAEVVSRKTIPEAEHATVEVVAKSSMDTAHSIRCRVICTGIETHSLTAITPIAQDNAHIKALDQMFAEFRAK